MESEHYRIDKKRESNEQMIMDLQNKFLELEHDNKRLSSQNLDEKINRNKLDYVQKSVDAFEEDYTDFKQEF